MQPDVRSEQNSSLKSQSEAKGRVGKKVKEGPVVYNEIEIYSLSGRCTVKQCACRAIVLRAIVSDPCDISRHE